MVNKFTMSLTGLHSLPLVCAFLLLFLYVWGTSSTVCPPGKWNCFKALSLTWLEDLVHVRFYIDCAEDRNELLFSKSFCTVMEIKYYIHLSTKREQWMASSVASIVFNPLERRQEEVKQVETKSSWRYPIRVPWDWPLRPWHLLGREGP